MANVNKFICIGRLTRDPEFGMTKSNMSYCRITLATSRKYTSNGESKKDTFFISATAWSKKAEFINEYLSKGNLVYVEGPLATNKWEDKDGNARQETYLTINEIQILEGKQFNKPTEG